MLHNGKRVELKVALECSRSWLHSLETYRNREFGRPYEPDRPKIIPFVKPEREAQQ